MIHKVDTHMHAYNVGFTGSALRFAFNTQPVRPLGRRLLQLGNTDNSSSAPQADSSTAAQADSPFPFLGTARPTMQPSPAPSPDLSQLSVFDLTQLSVGECTKIVQSFEEDLGSDFQCPLTGLLPGI
jgi:hypothetical protein